MWFYLVYSSVSAKSKSAQLLEPSAAKEETVQEGNPMVKVEPVEDSDIIDFNFANTISPCLDVFVYNIRSQF